jgi:recombination protein RecA
MVFMATAAQAQDSKMQAVKLAMEQIEKQFGKGSIMKLGDSAGKMDVETIQSGSIALDMALGGGYPKGRIMEIYGPESSGKTTLTLHAVAEVQKNGGTAAFVDAEHALDPLYAKRIGVDVENLLVSQPDTGEQALEITETLIRSGAVDIIVVDSVAALTPRAEIEGEMGDSHMGLQARLMSQALRKLTGAISRAGTTVIFTNQLREKIGVMFGNPETTTGGRALKFYASVRLEVRRTGQIKDGDTVTGSQTKVKVVKNKVAPPFRTAEFDIMYNEGISQSGSTLDVAVELDIIHKAGSWFSYGDDKIGQGRESAKAYLKERPKLMEEINKKIRDSKKEVPFEIGHDATDDDDGDVRVDVVPVAEIVGQ